MAWRPFLAVALALCLNLNASTARPDHKQHELLDRVWRAVEKGLIFFTEDYSSINVDGLFGLRVGQGQIQESIKEYEKRTPSKMKKTTLKRLRGIDEALSSAGDGALPYVEAHDPAYYRRFLPVIDKPYHLKFHPHLFGNLSSITVGNDDNYDEERGDACFARLLGTYSEHGKTWPRCTVSRSCLEMMTKPYTVGYVITHQLLYFILIQKLGCQVEVSQLEDVTSVKQLEDRLCATIYKETQGEVRESNVADPYKDLFLEQSLLCGMLGYTDFVREDWLRMVLRWQARDGCFKLTHDAPMDLLDVLTRRSRSLLRDKTMKDGCLAHMTGLGFGTLCLYLRVLLHFSVA